jgi:arylsulfatase A-like enzyme
MTLPGASTRSKGQFNPLGAVDVLMWSTWLGLVAGLLEVGTRVVCRAIDPTNRLYLMSRHFVWLTPLANLILFLVLGLCLARVTRRWPRPGGWLSARLLCALAILPMLIVAAPRILTAAWFVFALGVASRLVPWLESKPPRSRRSFLVKGTFSLLALVLILTASVFAADWLKHMREARRAYPPAGSPNILFIVLDTVRADRLSLHGYRRPTTPTLERLAQNGIRFDRARATAPWTLPSHASFFSGRWPHELDARWLTPLRTDFPLMAEYLASRGYATAGVVANTNYCSYDTGLDRGFTYYEDYSVEKLGFLRMAVLVEGLLHAVFESGLNYEAGPLRSLREIAVQCFYSGVRSDAATINRRFLAWLAGRPDPARPFFVFLNYVDAHAPYKLPDGALHPFGHKPRSADEVRVVYDGWPVIDKLKLPKHYLNMARDAYDNCLAYLDEQLGLLFPELQRRGLLDRTLVVITSDHGEGLGEHGLFDHGESLYSTELTVPLLILLPSPSRTTGVVRQVVSLRDLPATIVDLIGLGAQAPFPGHSLAKLWRDSEAEKAAASPALSELPTPSPRDCNQGRSPAYRGPMIALAEADFVYIRNEGDGAEELFDERGDPYEVTNRISDKALQPVVQRIRDRISPFRMGARGGKR